MENNILDTQIGGDHYKKLVMQPIVLITKANCNFIQGCIIKYISRYKCKNGKEDVLKCIHYAELALELLPEETNYFSLGLGYSYIKANSLSYYEGNVIIEALRGNYSNVIINCRKILQKEYANEV